MHILYYIHPSISIRAGRDQKARLAFPVRRAAFFCFTVIVLMSFISVFPIGVSSSGLDSLPLEHAGAIYLYNVENNKVLIEKDADKRIYPASTVKIMTGLIAIEQLSTRLDEKIVISADMLVGVLGNNYGLVPGDTPTVLDLLYLTLCGGYNDAVAVLVYIIAGDASSFLVMMNNRANDIGMKNTYYANATGIHNDLMYTTAADTAILALEASKSNLFMEITSAAKYITVGLSGEYSVYNRNDLVSKVKTAKYYNSRCRGMNSGMTVQGGYCLVTLAQSEGLSYVCVVMGASEATDGTVYSYIIADGLIEWVCRTYGFVEVLSESSIICEVPVTMSSDNETVLVVPEKSLSFFLPTSTVVGTDITYTYKLTVESLEAPVGERTQVGFVTVMLGDTTLATVALVTKTSVGKSNLLYAIERIRAFSASRFFRATLVCAVILTLFYLIIKSTVRAVRNNRHTRYR